MKTTNISEIAKTIYQESTVIDLQLGFEPEIEATYKWDILAKFAASKFSLLSLAMATDATSLDRTIQYIAHVSARIKTESDKFILVKNLQDIERAKKENKLGLTFLLQGPNPLAKNLDMLDVYYEIGVRSLILAYNIRNPFADGCSEAVDAGLSRLGKQLIKKMNEIGMLVDLSHTGYKSGLEAIELSQHPVIFSHSNVHSLYPHPRNLKDDQIKALAKSGGVIGINGNSGLLSNSKATPAKYVEHIDYIAQLVGPEFVALGTDLVYFPELFDNYMTQNAIFYSSDYRKSIESQPLTSVYPNQIIEVVELLLLRGYSKNAIAGILGKNYLQVIEKVWQ